MTVAESFEGMLGLFTPSAATGLNKTIQFAITGDDSGTYAIKIENQTCQLIPGGVEKPDLTLTLSDKDWLAITRRELDAMSAFMSGKIKATGDMMLAMRIPDIFKLR